MHSKDVTTCDADQFLYASRAFLIVERANGELEHIQHSYPFVYTLRDDEVGHQYMKGDSARRGIPLVEQFPELFQECRD